jgi:hypothetical protein
VASRFLFDGLVFDAAYFREKMAEHRRRRLEQRRSMARAAVDNRSGTLHVSAIDLGSIPGLVDDLDSLVSGVGQAVTWQPEGGFDLRRYQSHIRAHVHDFPVASREIPCLREDPRKDLIWRFVAATFMAHFGQLDVWQEGVTIWVTRHEAHGEGQGVP